MPKIDLLPCPFCGKPDTAEIITVAECGCMGNPTEWDREHYGVVCDNSIKGGCGASTGWNYTTPEEAAKEWNTRASGWISCSVKLPEVGEPVLIYDPYNEEMVVASLDCDKIGFSNDDYWYGLKNVPFWMPLPEPPKED